MELHERQDYGLLAPTRINLGEEQKTYPVNKYDTQIRHRYTSEGEAWWWMMPDGGWHMAGSPIRYFDEAQIINELDDQTPKTQHNIWR